MQRRGQKRLLDKIITMLRGNGHKRKRDT